MSKSTGRSRFPNAKIVTVRVHEDKWKELQKIAQAEMTTAAALVRKAIDYMIEAKKEATT